METVDFIVFLSQHLVYALTVITLWESATSKRHNLMPVI
jgi:hypothetical protein